MLRIVGLLASALLAAAPARAQPPLPQIELNAGLYVIHAELATTPAERMLGLMGRREMAENHGMLFDFERPGDYCMWMKNTLIPLSVAFLDGTGAIINIAEMAPRTEDPHCATQPARYALEMNRGWFARHGIAAGALLRGLAR